MWGKTQSAMLPAAAGGLIHLQLAAENGHYSASLGGALSAGATVCEKFEPYWTHSLTDFKFGLVQSLISCIYSYMYFNKFSYFAVRHLEEETLVI